MTWTAFAILVMFFITIHTYSSKRYLVTYFRLCIYSRQSALNGRRYCAGCRGDKCAPGRVAVWVTRVQPVPIAMHWGQSRRRGARADHWQGCSESETQPSLGQPYAFPLRPARTHPPFLLHLGHQMSLFWSNGFRTLMSVAPHPPTI